MKVKKMRFPFRILYYDFYLRYRLHRVIKYKKLDTNLIIGQDHIIGKDYFLKYNYHLVEDGLGLYSTFYIEQAKYKKRYFLNKMLRRKRWNGMENTVTKIYLTKKENIPHEIRHKVELINLKELWKKKTEEEKTKILKIFDFSIEKMKNLSAKNYILFTQPLSEDSVISEEEKIDIYKKVIKNYDKKKLIIKTHPRETTDYSKIFPEIAILNAKFPAELLFIFNIPFEKVITLFSTSVMIFENSVEIDFYGTEVNEKLLRRFGATENIMKRNVYI
ncbi:hypothetical protein EGX98_02665 [Fusobacterium necrophorum]|nr:hypothetical protein EGX98_02665 [Fusobacterium necrophorum]AZW10294.1 hypothetical protein EO219_04735 [Fusobacterium necrophorum subsp. necrophorum]